MEIPNAWRQAAETIAALPPGSVYVVGEPNSGKTTFVSYLRRYLEENATGANLLDCDPGQSTVGPPATIGLQLVTGETLLKFAGSTSPVGYLLQNLRAIVGLALRTCSACAKEGRTEGAGDAAREAGAEKGRVEKSCAEGAGGGTSLLARPLIIDSSGFVRPPPAREFQHSIIDILRPDLVVEIGDSDAIDETLRSFPDLAANGTIRLPVSSAIRTRSSDERRRYRDRRFGEHFEGAAAFRFDDARVGMTGRVPQHHGDHPRSDKIRDTLVGLADSEGLLLGLGLAEAWGGSGLEIWTAVADAAPVASIQWSGLRLERATIG